MSPETLPKRVGRVCLPPQGSLFGLEAQGVAFGSRGRLGSTFLGTGLAPGQLVPTTPITDSKPTPMLRPRSASWVRGESSTPSHPPPTTAATPSLQASGFDYLCSIPSHLLAKRSPVTLAPSVPLPVYPPRTKDLATVSSPCFGETTCPGVRSPCRREAITGPRF